MQGLVFQSRAGLLHTAQITVNTVSLHHWKTIPPPRLPWVLVFSKRTEKDKAHFLWFIQNRAAITSVAHREPSPFAV